MDPGTAAIATLASIVGVAGYGANQVNKDQASVIDGKVQSITGRTQAELISVKEQLRVAEEAKQTQEISLKALQKEIDSLKRGKPVDSFFNMFTRRRANASTVPGDPIGELPSGPEPDIEPDPIETPDSDADSDSGSDSDSESDAPPVVPPGPSVVPPDVPPTSTPSVPPPPSDPPISPDVPPSDPPIPPDVPLGPSVVPPTPPSEGPEEEEAMEREVLSEEKAECTTLLNELNIKKTIDRGKWVRKNPDDPRIAQVNNCVDINLRGKRGGTVRKKKLRTRHGGKQSNVRRSRRSKNRPNRPTSNSSRRSKVNAGRDESSIR
jgi:hypothetical protein